MNAIISSMLDTDLYKISMGQFVLFQYPDVDVRFQLFNRGNTPFPPGLGRRLAEEIEKMADLKAESAELDFLRKACPWIKPSYLDWLSTYRFNPNEVRVLQSEDKLEIQIEGPWYRTIYWEVPLMATTSELFFTMTHQHTLVGWEEKARRKAERLLRHDISWAEFGTRRRFSYFVQEEVLRQAMAVQQEEQSSGLIGTSNVHFAHKLGLKPIGTMAHEIFMVLGAICGYPIANRLTMEGWVKEFDGRLGIALPDTFTTDVFLRDFTWQFAKQFDGVRQDSGIPEEFVEKLIGHYQSLKIDPLEKTVVPSDGLNDQRAIEIADYCRGRIKCSFGIGTYATNDVGVTPLNIVIKVVAARRTGGPWLPTGKLSDDKGKWTGNDPKVFEAIRTTLGIT